jgi:hypothetical protein
MRLITRGLLVKSGVLLAVLFAAFLATGVVLAQSSQDFDLGCRGDMTAGGKWTDYSNPQVQLSSSFGLWNAGTTTVQGSGIVVESGFILGGGQVSSSAQSANSAGGLTEEPAENAAVLAEAIRLPAIFALKAVRYVRPCNWPW